MADIKPVYHTLNPNIIVRDAMKAIEYYKNVFDAKERRIFHSPKDPKMVMHAELEIGDSVLMLSDEFPEMHALSPKSPGGGTSVSFYLLVEDVDKVFSNAVSKGGTITMPLADTFWGDRAGSIVDPFGHVWMIATHKKDLSDKEIEEAAKEAFKH